MHFAPWLHMGAYHRIRNGGVSSFSFTELAHWPLRYADGAAPPSRVPFWIYHPCAYRYREDGAFYDYVLVQGGARPFDGDVPGAVFEPIAHEGAFTLYAKTTAPPDDTSPDRGPCRAP